MKIKPEVYSYKTQEDPEHHLLKTPGKVTEVLKLTPKDFLEWLIDDGEVTVRRLK